MNIIKEMRLMSNEKSSYKNNNSSEETPIEIFNEQKISKKSVNRADAKRK